MPKIIEDEVIFRAVIQTVVARGYVGATTKEMADAAGVSEVTLFRKYESKLQLVRRAITAIVEQTDFEAAIQYTGNIQADLLNMLTAFQNSAIMHHQFFVVLFSEAARNPDLADLYAQPLRLFQSIGQLLARYQDEYILKQEHPLHAAATLLGPLIYLAMINSTITQVQLPPIDLSTHVRHFLEGRVMSESMQPGF